jgi:RimJ/RimL family protein N-acetyltransferase
LLTRRLRLRPLTGGDLDDLVELDSDPAVMRFLRTVFLDWPDPLPGTEQGEVEYAMHRSDWQARQRIR